MKTIKLNGKQASGKTVKVDNDDYENLKNYKWYMNDNGYALTTIRRKHIRMHRLIMNATKNKVVDHLNHDRLDNRKSNLRLCSQKENANNRKGDKGYCWDASKNKFMVRYKNVFYGRYKTEDEAKQAYKLACSGVPYAKKRRKLWYLPTGITKQFGKYRVRPQVNGKRIWLGQFATLEEAQNKLTEWQKRG